MEDKQLEMLLDNLIKTLDDNIYIQKIKSNKEKLYRHKKLDKIIMEYQNTGDYEKKLKLKKELFNDNLFKEFKENEFEINLLIMKINKIFQNLDNEKNCIQ